MKRGVISTAIVALFGLSSAAFAQMQGEVASITGPSTALNGTVEVAPMTLLLNAAPGVGAAGVAGEVFLTDQTALMAEGTFFNANLSENLKGRMESDLTPDDVDGYMAAVGAQRYSAPATSSWYWGGKVGYSEMNGTWDYRDSTIDQNTRTVVPAAMGGYRWLLRDRISLRLGGTIGANLVQSNSVDALQATAEAEEGKDRLDDLVTSPVYAQVDFLLGYAF